MGSRLTFRDKCPGVAWQRQLRDHYVGEGVPNVPHLDLKRAVVKPVSRKLAEQIILKYEWLGSMAQTSHHYGIFFGLHCAGVCCFGSCCTGGPYISKEWGLRVERLFMLARGACVHWAPPGSNSKLISWACRLLARDTGAKITIAYSDTDAGEIGTVYQASNWICVGRTAPVEQWVAPNGRVYDGKYPADRTRSRGGTRSDWILVLKANGWHRQKGNAKHRYVYILDKTDKALVERVEAKRTPYPKRSAAAPASDAATNRVGRGSTDPVAPSSESVATV